MTLPVYLQNLSFILNTTIYKFKIGIHDNIDTNKAKHDFAQQCIRHDVPLLIRNIASNMQTKLQFTMA